MGWECLHSLLTLRAWCPLQARRCTHPQCQNPVQPYLLALYSSWPFSLTAQSPSLSTGSSELPASSISSNTLSASSIAMPASSPPSLPSVAQSSVPTATATSPVDMVLEPNPTTSASLASSTTSTTAPP